MRAPASAIKKKRKLSDDIFAAISAPNCIAFKAKEDARITDISTYIYIMMDMRVCVQLKI